MQGSFKQTSTRSLRRWEPDPAAVSETFKLRKLWLPILRAQKLVQETTSFFFAWTYAQTPRLKAAAATPSNELCLQPYVSTARANGKSWTPLSLACHTWFFRSPMDTYPGCTLETNPLFPIKPFSRWRLNRDDSYEAPLTYTTLGRHKCSGFYSSC